MQLELSNVLKDEEQIDVGVEDILKKSIDQISRVESRKVSKDAKSEADKSREEMKQSLGMLMATDKDEKILALAE